MSRSKKSRKPGGAPTAKPKLSKVELASVEKRIRKKTGKKPGNRQQEALQIKDAGQNANHNKDPRIGSKKPIDLGGSANVSQAKPKAVNVAKAKQDPIAAIRTVSSESVDVEANSVESLVQELANIEADDRLQTLLVKQEEEIALTEQEVDYFNEMMERHQQISAQLDEDEDEETSENSVSSEDDLWDKLDNAPLPDASLDDS